MRLLARHPGFRVVRATSGRLAGTPLRDACPWLDTSLELSSFDPADPGAEFVLLAQENGFAMRHAATLIDAGARVVDLSADHRLRDPEAYRAYYKAEPAPEGHGAVYGLPELGERDAIRSARLVANPGCHVTAAVLALLPLVRAGRVTGTPVIDTKTGASGAGRARKESEYLLSEALNDVRAYGVVGHRHTPEIEQALGGLPIRFTPHILPMPRGLLATVAVPVSDGADLDALYREFYADAATVRVVAHPPTTKATLGTARCDVWATYDARLGMAVVCAALDNLGKGAAAAAIQNLNLMAGYEEAEGLPLDGLWP
jgi:N-acetyl-gamma-glutamyl-phosphate reductase